MSPPWNVLESQEYRQWFSTLSDKQRAAVLVRVLWLTARGPVAGRPYVDSITRSSLSNLKELRISSDGQLRILFLFSSGRNLLLLIGGDKSESGLWNKWYESAVPAAESIVQRFEELGE